MKKIISLFLLVIAVFALSACKSSANNVKIIKFAVQPDSTNALTTLINTFNAQKNGYKVEAVTMSSDSDTMHDTLVTSLQSGSSDYDVVSMDVVWAGEFAAAGYLLPLDQFISDNGWTVSDFNAGSMASGTYGGKHYALPYFPDLGLLYFRKDIVSTADQAKLTSGNYTYQDLYNMAQEYTGKGGTQYGFVYQSAQYEGLVCNLNEFSDNWQDIQGGLQMMKQFTDASFTPSDILNYQESQTATAFLNGQAVFARNWPYMNGMVGSQSTITADQVGYAPLPNGGSVGGWLVGINKNTKDLAGAEAFIKFLSGAQGQKINSTVGSYLPGYNSLLSDPDVLAANKLLSDPAFQLALQHTIARPVEANYTQVSNEIQLDTHKYLAGDESLATAVANIKQALGQ